MLWGPGVPPVNADGRKLLPNVLVDAEGCRPCPTEAVHPVHPLAPQSHTHVVAGGLGDRRLSGAGPRAPHPLQPGAQLHPARRARLLPGGRPCTAQTGPL